MMLASKIWYWNTISADSALLIQLGGASHLADARPEVITIFPMVILTDEEQHDMEFADNKPKAVTQVVKVDIFTKNISGLSTTSEIGINVARIFDDLFFACLGNREVPEPLDGFRHRVMRFSRELFPSDLV
jgi:hypothetical protein